MPLLSLERRLTHLLDTVARKHSTMQAIPVGTAISAQTLTTLWSLPATALSSAPNRLVITITIIATEEIRGRQAVPTTRRQGSPMAIKTVTDLTHTLKGPLMRLGTPEIAIISRDTPQHHMPLRLAHQCPMAAVLQQSRAIAVEMQTQSAIIS